MLEPERTMLLHWLRHATVRGQFQLRSGQQTDTYVDVRRVCCEVSGRALIGDLLAAELDQFHPVSVGGLGVGGILVAQAVAHHRRCASFVLREQAKIHGLNTMVDGVLERDDQVAIVEDVVTTGAAVNYACQLVEAYGATVVAVGVVLDRGGSKLLEAAGYPVIALATLQDIVAREKEQV